MKQRLCNILLLRPLLGIFFLRNLQDVESKVGASSSQHAVHDFENDVAYMDQTEEFSRFGDEDSHDVDATTTDNDSDLIFLFIFFNDLVGLLLILRTNLFVLPRFVCLFRNVAILTLMCLLRQIRTKMGTLLFCYLNECCWLLD